MKNLIMFFCLFLGLGGNAVLAQQLIYKPVNPAFGGETFNYQWMLSSAQSQNKLEEKAADRLLNNSFDDFESSLNRQILSQLSRKLVDDVFGESNGELQEGTFEFGNLQVEITYEAEGINVSILNSSDGTQTDILIPYY